MFKMLPILLVVAAVLGFQLTERFPEYAGPLPAWTAMETITGKVTHVRDGDTIEIEGQPIRFGSLDCAERGSRRGDAATHQMQSLSSEQVFTCYLNGRTSYDRAIGSCAFSDGSDLASAMIKGGYCSRYF